MKSIVTTILEISMLQVARPRHGAKADRQWTLSMTVGMHRNLQERCQSIDISIFLHKFALVVSLLKRSDGLLIYHEF